MKYPGELKSNTRGYYTSLFGRFGFTNGHVQAMLVCHGATDLRETPCLLDQTHNTLKCRDVSNGETNFSFQGTIFGCVHAKMLQKYLLIMTSCRLSTQKTSIYTILEFGDLNAFGCWSESKPRKRWWTFQGEICEVSQDSS